MLSKGPSGEALYQANEPILLGVDIGTGSCKISLLSTQSLGVTTYSECYPLIIPRRDWVEVNPDVVLDRVFHLIRRDVPEALRARVKGIGLAGFTPSLIPVDSEGEPLANCLTNLDKRAFREAEWIGRLVGPDALYELTGKHCLPKYLAPKILWIKNNWYSVYQAAHKFLQVKDYLVFKLCGTYCTDPISASNSLLFDLNQGRWCLPMVEVLGIDAHKLPDVHPPTTIIGALTGGAARRTGLREGTPVVCGASDDAVAMLTLGAKGTTALLSTGTSTIFAVNVGLADAGRLREGEVVPGIFPGTRRIAFVNHATGAALRWLVEEVFAEPASAAAKPLSARIAELETEAEEIEVGSDGVVVLPSFEGTGTGDSPGDMKGVIWGLSIGHTKAHIYRALLEGIAVRLRGNLTLLREAGVAVRSLMCAGGASGSKLFRQITADSLGLPLLKADVPEPSALGAAILAGEGTDSLPDVYGLHATLVGEIERTSPVPERAGRYLKLEETIRCGERRLYGPVGQ